MDKLVKHAIRMLEIVEGENDFFRNDAKRQADIAQAVYDTILRVQALERKTEPQTDDLQDWKDRMWAEAVIEPTISPSDCATCKHDLWSTPRTCGKCVGQKDGKPSMYEPKDEPQTDCSWGAPDGEI